MSLTFSRARGTHSPTFQLGRDGPLVKGDAGAVQIRDAADAALARLQVATPTSADDAVSKAWAEANLAAPSGVVRAVAVPVGTTNATSTLQIPQNAVVLGVRVNVTQAYDAGATLEVGTSGDPDAFLVSSDVDPEATGLTLHPQASPPLGAAEAVQVTVGGTPAAGQATVVVEFTEAAA
jgi:hypothetical protein